MRVTNLDNGRHVDVHIVDRGPADAPRKEGVIIDLSRAAADALGFVEDGRARVRVDVLRWGTQTTSASFVSTKRRRQSVVPLSAFHNALTATKAAAPLYLGNAHGLPQMNGCLERCITVAPRQSGQKWVVSLERSEFTQEFQRQGEAENFARQRASSSRRR